MKPLSTKSREATDEGAGKERGDGYGRLISRHLLEKCYIGFCMIIDLKKGP